MKLLEHILVLDIHPFEIVLPDEVIPARESPKRWSWLAPRLSRYPAVKVTAGLAKKSLLRNCENDAVNWPNSSNFTSFFVDVH